MRVRGRRIALLIAGALPLLAEDDQAGRAVAIDAVVIPPEQHQEEHQKEEIIVVEAAEALHEQALSLLPLNLLQIESDFSAVGSQDVNNKANTARDGDAEGVDGEEGLIEDGEETVDDDSGKVPPAEEEETELLARIMEEEDSVRDPLSGTKLLEEVSADEEEEKAEDVSAASTNLVVDAEEDVKGDTRLDTVEEETTTKTTTSETSEPAAKDADVVVVVDTGNTTKAIQDVAEGETDAEDELTAEDDELTKDNVEDGSTAEISEGEKDDKIISSESGNQQPTAEPQVDKVVDDEEEASISDRVAVDYASKSAGALVLEKSSRFKGTSNLLNGDRDRYAISPCEEKKFVVLSLSEDILVKQVKLANYELYSSRVKNFQIQISQTMGNWVDLGSYTASHKTGVQSFDLREPAWGRYLKFKFTSHYGDEFYCTLSQIMVHGSTMVQGFHEHLEEESFEEEEATPEGGSDEAENADAVPSEDLDSAATKSDGNTDGEPVEQQVTPGEDAQSVGRSYGEEGEAPDGGGAAGETGDSVTESMDDDASNPSDDDSVDVDGTAQPGDNQKEESAEDAAAEEDKMSTKKVRNSSTALPAASIGLSSDVFSTIIGHVEPLHLKSMHRLSTMQAPALPDANQLHSMLEKASDSTKAITKALTDPALLDNLQLWNEASIENPFPPEAFGSTAIGPREQTLAEKLAAYIDASDDSLTTAGDEGDDVNAEPTQDAAAAEKEETVSDGKKQTPEAAVVRDGEGSAQDSQTAEEEQVASKASNSVEDSFESLHDTDLALADLLDKLPSIECLKKLDFAAFKDKALALRRGANGPGGHAATGNHAEPIFKMLTDQIKVLQSNLLVHDQFTKEAVQCYQRVLLDVVVELQTVRFEHEARLSKLEEGLEETKTVRWIFVLYQLVMGLPHWASLLAATFFTSFVSPNAITRPIEHVQRFLVTYVSEGDHYVLSWTISSCIMIVCVVTTLSLCHRVVSAIGNFKRKSASEGKSPPKKDATEENSCRFTVETTDGALVSVITKPVITSNAEMEAGSPENSTVTTAATRDVPVVADSMTESTDVDAEELVLPARGQNEEVYRESAQSANSQADESESLAAVESEPRLIDEDATEATADEATSSTDDTPAGMEQTAPAPDEIEKTAVAPPDEATSSTDDSTDDTSADTEQAGPSPDEIEKTTEASSDEATSLTDCISGETGQAAPSPDEIEKSNEATYNDETRAPSGTRTPDVEAATCLDFVSKDPISPSSVARVSEIAAATVPCVTPGPPLAQNQSQLLEPQREDLTQERENETAFNGTDSGC